MQEFLRYVMIWLGIVWVGIPIFAQQTQQKTLTLMGSAFVFSAADESDTLAWEAIEAGIAEVRRIEALISSWDPNSQTSEINRNAGIQPVKVDWELFALIRRALKVAQLTQGAFDPSFAAIDQVWRFDGSMQSLPSEAEIQHSVRNIDYQKVILNAQDTTVYVEKGMKLSFGAIGKGYAANRAKQVMQSLGVAHGLVNAGGDLICWGKKGGNTDWRIGIADPETKGQVRGWLSINDLAVVTSGDYEKFAMIEGVRYAHIIDPRTGYPAHGLRSVSIFCPDVELADALATAVFVMGKEEGLSLVNQLRGIEVVLITDEGDIVSSKGLRLEFEGNEEELEWKIGEKREVRRER